MPPETLKSISPEEVYQQLKDSPAWIVEQHRIYRDFRFENFNHALAFVNRVAEAAAQVGHHPNILMHEYSFVRIETYNHLTNTLSWQDLQLVRAIDKIINK